MHDRVRRGGQARAGQVERANGRHGATGRNDGQYVRRPGFMSRQAAHHQRPIRVRSVTLVHLVTGCLEAGRLDRSGWRECRAAIRAGPATRSDDCRRLAWVSPATGFVWGRRARPIRGRRMPPATPEVCPSTTDHRHIAVCGTAGTIWPGTHPGADRAPDKPCWSRKET